MVAEPVKLIIWGLCLFSSPLFSFSNFNSFHDIYMHIIVSSHKLAVQLWGAFKIVCVCEEMVGLCVCSNECCHVPVSAAAAYNEVDFCHLSFIKDLAYLFSSFPKGAAGN